MGAEKPINRTNFLFMNTQMSNGYANGTNIG